MVNAVVNRKSSRHAGHQEQDVRCQGLANERDRDQQDDHRDAESDEVAEAGDEGKDRAREPELVRHARAVDDRARPCWKRHREVTPSEHSAHHEGRVGLSGIESYEVRKDGDQDHRLDQRHRDDPEDAEGGPLVTGLKILTSQDSDHRPVVPQVPKPSMSRPWPRTQLQAGLKRVGMPLLLQCRGAHWGRLEYRQRCVRDPSFALSGRVVWAL